MSWFPSRRKTPRGRLPSGCRKAFPAHGEGGPLAVDEVPAKRIMDSVVPGQVGQKVRPLVFKVKTVPPVLTCFSLFLGPTVSFFAFSPHSSEFPAMDIGEDSVNPGWGSSHTSTFSCSNHRFLCPSSRALPIAGFCFQYTEPQAFSVEKRSSLIDFCSIV